MAAFYTRLDLTVTLLMLCVLPLGNLIDEVCQFIPELISQRPLIYVDNGSVGLGVAILYGCRDLLQKLSRVTGGRGCAKDRPSDSGTVGA